MATELAVEKCSITDIFNVKDELPAELSAAINAYLAPFAKPIWGTKDGTPPTAPDLMGLTGERCLNCNASLSGFLGAFVFGIAHGEGRCSKCKWPIRAKHNIADPAGGEDIAQFPMMLCYHPEFVEANGSDGNQ